MGRTGRDRITIINPKGESYDMDRFGMIVSTREDGLIPDLRLQPPKPTSEVEQEPRRYGRGDEKGGTREPRVGGPAIPRPPRAAVSVLVEPLYGHS